MQIEIEKKYNLTENDYKIIKQKTDFLEKIEIKDYYLDKDFILANNWYFLRLRNWKYELKINNYDTNTKTNYNEEYDNETEIEEKISELWITTDDVSGIMFVDTLREKYKYNYNWEIINIDIDKYQYWERYEIEIIKNINDNENKLEFSKKISKIIEDFRKEVWLEWVSDESSCKTINCAMHQNIELYEIMTK